MGRQLMRTLGLTLAVIAAWLTAEARAEARSVRVGSAADLLAVAEQAVRRGDGATAEKAFRALLADRSPEVRAEARFRLAKLIAAAGRSSEAAVLLRRVLDDYPAAVPARLELAALFGTMGRQEDALRELRAVRTSDLPPAVARFVDRWSASLQAVKPFGVQVEFALAPDSNINRATRSDTLATVIGDFTFDEDAKRRSGVGLAARGWAHRRLALGKDFNLVARASADLNLYRDKEFNDISAELAAGPEFKLLGTRFTVEGGIGQRWYGMDLFQRQVRLAASATRTVGAVGQVRLDASIRLADNRLNDLQDGHGWSLAARYERALSPSMSIVGFVAVDRFKAKDDAYSTRSWLAGASLHRYVGRMTLSLGADVGRLKGDDRLALLPDVREDRLTRFSAGAVFRQLTVAGFAPMARVVVERNRSSVEFYDFKRTRTELGISRAF